jgi:hypothetical protein
MMSYPKTLAKSEEQDNGKAMNHLLEFLEAHRPTKYPRRPVEYHMVNLCGHIGFKNFNITRQRCIHQSLLMERPDPIMEHNRAMYKIIACLSICLILSLETGKLLASNPGLQLIHLIELTNRTPNMIRLRKLRGTYLILSEGEDR